MYETRNKCKGKRKTKWEYRKENFEQNLKKCFTSLVKSVRMYKTTNIRMRT